MHKASSKVVNILFLIPLNRSQLIPEFINTLFECTGFVRDLRGPCRCLSPRFTLNHDVEIDKFFCQGRHVVLKAERVLADGIGGEDIVALMCAVFREKREASWIEDSKVYIK